MKSGLIYINTATASAAEAVLSTLREVLGSLPVRPVTVKIAPSATFSDWIRTETTADGFYVLSNCRLSDTGDEAGEINFKNQDLTGDEIKALLASGKVVTQLRLAYKDRLSFTVDDKLAFRAVRFDDLVQEQAAQDGGDDAAGQLDASFWLMISTLNEMLPILLTALGGEELPQSI